MNILNYYNCTTFIHYWTSTESVWLPSHSLTLLHYSFTQSLTVLATHLFNQLAFADSTHALIHSHLNHLLNDPFTNPVTDPFTHSLTHSLHYSVLVYLMSCCVTLYGTYTLSLKENKSHHSSLSVSTCLSLFSQFSLSLSSPLPVSFISFPFTSRPLPISSPVGEGGRG